MNHAYLHPDIPKIGDTVTCVFCGKQKTVISVTPDKWGGHYHTAKHECIKIELPNYSIQENI